MLVKYIEEKECHSRHLLQKLEINVDIDERLVLKQAL
jgi:hypothetical protein